MPPDKYEIIDIINDLDTNKACGPHSIPTDILHTKKMIVVDPLTDIINLSFANGKYIDVLKTIPGVEVQFAHPNGRNVNLSIRGSSDYKPGGYNNRVLILLDGFEFKMERNYGVSAQKDHL